MLTLGRNIGPIKSQNIGPIKRQMPNKGILKGRCLIIRQMPNKRQNIEAVKRALTRPVYPFIKLKKL